MKNEDEDTSVLITKNAAIDHLIMFVGLAAVMLIAIYSTNYESVLSIYFPTFFLFGGWALVIWFVSERVSNDSKTSHASSKTACRTA